MGKREEEGGGGGGGGGGGEGGRGGEEGKEEEVGLNNLNASRGWKVKLAEGDQTVRKVFAACGSGCSYATLHVLG